jgi:hypothetical protein
MSPARFDLAVYEGDSYAWQFNLWTDDTKTTPVDLTGAAAAAQIRDSPGGTVVVALTCVITLPGTIVATLDHPTSETVPQSGVWDLQVTSASGWVTTFVAGKVFLTADVTQ